MWGKFSEHKYSSENSIPIPRNRKKTENISLSYDVMFTLNQKLYQKSQDKILINLPTPRQNLYNFWLNLYKLDGFWLGVN